MQADAEWFFPIFLSQDKYGPSLYSRIPNMSSLLKTFKILFRDHFFDMPNRQRVKARRKLGFCFGMITSDLDAPPSKRESAVKTIIS